MKRERNALAIRWRGFNLCVVDLGQIDRLVLWFLRLKCFVVHVRLSGRF